MCVCVRACTCLWVVYVAVNRSTDIFWWRSAFRTLGRCASETKLKKKGNDLSKSRLPRALILFYTSCKVFGHFSLSPVFLFDFFPSVSSLNIFQYLTIIIFFWIIPYISFLLILILMPFSESVLCPLFLKHVQTIVFICCRTLIKFWIATYRFHFQFCLYACTIKLKHWDGFTPSPPKRQSH